MSHGDFLGLMLRVLRTPRIAVSIAVIANAAVAYGQAVDRRYREAPAGAVALPATPLAGEHDARAVALNAGGLPLLRGPELALALDLENSNFATSSGPGFGTYLATSGGGTVL